MNTENITLDKLTPEAKRQLLRELEAEQAQKEREVKDNRKAYKALVNETIPALFHELLGASATLSAAKTKVINELQALIAMKAGVYGREDNKYSHSFTTDDGITLMLGTIYRDGWDDTVTAGIKKTTDYLESLGKDENSRKLVRAVMKLLSKDATGNLKASKVLQLKKMAEEWGDKEFVDAVNIIQEAYRPSQSRIFISCKYKDNDGITTELPLDIATAELDFKIPALYEKPKQETTEA